MKLIHLADIPKTKAHDNIIRQRFIAPNDLKSKIQTVNYAELEPGCSFTPHSHPDCDEGFFVLAGTAEANIAGQKVILQTGDFLVAEVGEEHTFVNVTKTVFKYFAFRVMM